MVLTTHAVAGAALGSFLPHPAAAFVIGFLSHFILDSLPHWDYQLESRRENGDPLSADMPLGPAFYRDLLKIGCDFLLGFGLLALWSHFWFDAIIDWRLWAGGIGGVLPDFLQFAYMKLRREPLVSLQRFHIWMHTKHELSGRPLLGVSLQGLLVAVAVLALYSSIL